MVKNSSIPLIIFIAASLIANIFAIQILFARSRLADVAVSHSPPADHAAVKPSQLPQTPLHKESSSLPAASPGSSFSPEVILKGLSNEQWSRPQLASAQQVWKTASAIPKEEAASMSLIDVYSIFPETYNCDKNYFGKIGLEKGDGGKWNCDELFKPKAGDCVVVSVGSNGQWDFELSVLAKTNNDCTVYTFDCTGSWEPPHPNIKFHPWCLGIDGVVKTKAGAGMSSNQYTDIIHKSWKNITATLGITHVDYFKIDIEGYEWVAMPEVLENWELGVRPNQIAIEIHLWPQVEHVPAAYQAVETSNGLDFLHPMVTMFEAFTKVGYQAASYEYNTLSVPFGCCAEYLFVRTDATVKSFKNTYGH